MTKEQIVARLIALANAWEREAFQSVPPEYRDRKMDYKYFNLDNEAAGLISCTDDIETLLLDIELSEELE